MDGRCDGKYTYLTLVKNFRSDYSVTGQTISFRMAGLASTVEEPYQYSLQRMGKQFDDLLSNL